MINLCQLRLLLYLPACQPSANSYAKFVLLCALFVAMAGCQPENNDADYLDDKNGVQADNAEHRLAENREQDGTLLLASGDTLAMQDLQKSVLLVNFWAIWCAPCRIEIPELNFLYNKQQINVLGIDFDQRAGEELQAAIAKMGIQFPVLSAKSAAGLDFYWPEALPVTLVVINLKVADILHGAQTSESLAKAITKAQNRVKAIGSG